MPEVHAYPYFMGDALERLVSLHGSVALVGDAGHPHGPFAGGAALAIDDAYTLTRSLNDVIQKPTLSKTEILRTTLELYDRARRPHIDRVMEEIHKRELFKSSTENIWREDFIRMFGKGGRGEPWMDTHSAEQAFLVVAQGGRSSSPKL